MEMHQVRYFLAAARLLNFTRAAQDSNVTQPALTRAIQKLEDELGGQLFRRERSRTHLTELGQAVIPHLEATYAGAESAKQIASEIGTSVISPLSLGIATSLNGPGIRQTIAEVAQTVSGFQLTISRARSESLIEALLMGSLNAAFLVAPPHHLAQLECIQIMSQDCIVIAPQDSPLCRIASPALEDLDGLTWIERPGQLAKAFRSACAQVGVRPNFRHSAGSDSDIDSLVGAGLGHAIAVEGRQLPNDVIPFSVRNLCLPATIVLATVPGRERSTATNALIKAVKLQLRDNKGVFAVKRTQNPAQPTAARLRATNDR